MVTPPNPHEHAAHPAPRSVYLPPMQPDLGPLPLYASMASQSSMQATANHLHGIFVEVDWEYIFTPTIAATDDRRGVERCPRCPAACRCLPGAPARAR